jgi:putative FmdB family regulatory protein
MRYHVRPCSTCLHLEWRSYLKIEDLLLTKLNTRRRTIPIYEYTCRKCGHTLEKIQKFSDAPLLECPECGEEALQKLISQGNFCLMGDNWSAPGMHVSKKH